MVRQQVCVRLNPRYRTRNMRIDLKDLVARLRRHEQLPRLALLCRDHDAVRANNTQRTRAVVDRLDRVLYLKQAPIRREGGGA